MTKETAIKLFDQKQIRTLWNEEQEKWYFSIVDVVGALTGSANPRKYWSVLNTYSGARSASDSGQKVE